MVIFSEDLSKVSMMVIGATSFSEREREKGKKYAKHANGFHTDSLFIMVTASLLVNHHYIILQLKLLHSCFLSNNNVYQSQSL